MGLGFAVRRETPFGAAGKRAPERLVHVPRAATMVAPATRETARRITRGPIIA
jgi:hypothetical protein